MIRQVLRWVAFAALLALAGVGGYAAWQCWELGKEASVQKLFAILYGAVALACLAFAAGAVWPERKRVQ